uniref:Amino acid ABC transporter permease n=1 Tax=Heterorhabditis bacteriophora TaxID=37862 RepID=A0A1I7XHV9_HETBA
MTSETQLKSYPYFIRAGEPRRSGLIGWAIIIISWTVLYFWGVTQLVDGFLDWTSYNTVNVIRVAVTVANAVSSIEEGLSNIHNGIFSTFIVMIISR